MRHHQGRTGISEQGRSGGSQQPDRTNSRKTNRHLARKRTVGKAFFRDCRRDGEEADRPLAAAFTFPACCGSQPGCVPSGSPRLRPARSEEPPSALQSLMRLSYPVFRLKKETNTLHSTHTLCK